MKVEHTNDKVSKIIPLSKDGYGKNHWPDVNESFKHGQIAYTPYIAFQTHEKPTSFAKRQMKSFLTKLSKIAPDIPCATS